MVPSWQTWWSFNRDPYLSLRARIAGMGATSGKNAGPGPTVAQIKGQVLPGLRAVLRRGGDAQVMRSALLALARIEDDIEDVRPGTDLSAIARAYLGTDFSAGVEAAIVALGVRGADESVEVLRDLLLDSEAGRAMRGEPQVASRTRAYAAYALGLCAAGSEDKALRARIGEDLAKVLIDDDRATYELHIACMLSMGLAPAMECAPGEHVDGHVCRGMQIGCMLNYFLDRERPEGLRAHAAAVMARLAVDADSEFEETVVGALLEAVDLRSKESAAVREGATIGLGHLADGSGEKLDRAVRSALEEIASRDDGLARRQALIALARVAARPGAEATERGIEKTRAALLQNLARGKDGMDGWAAMALAVLEHHTASERGQAVSDDIARALEHSLARAKSLEKKGAACVGLGILRRSEAADAVLDLLEDEEDAAIHGYAALALGLMGASEASEPMRELMESEDITTVWGAALGLRLLGDRQVAPQLMQRLAETEETAEGAVLARALGLLADRRTVKPLLDLLADEEADSDLRGAAAGALGAMCDEETASWTAPIANHLPYGTLPWTLVDPFGEGSGLLDMR